MTIVISPPAPTGTAAPLTLAQASSLSDIEQGTASKKISAQAIGNAVPVLTTSEANPASAGEVSGQTKSIYT